MKGVPWTLIIGVTIGVVIGLLLPAGVMFFVRLRRKQAQIRSNSLQRTSGIPLRINGVDTCTELSDSTAGQDSPEISEEHATSLWLKGPKRKSVVSLSGILRYSYKDLHKATGNFTTLIGQGAFGPVYKAQMSFGETVAVKVLDTDSKQGEKEFQAEVLLLGRLHHRNLVNLVGYCSEKGKNMLIYAYMTNGSLSSHLYGENKEPLSWYLRVSIALDVARGLEYLHDGAVPPVVHRDIKSANILLDHSMRARVADLGLSREEMVDHHVSNVRGTFGYLDPEYVSSRSFTKKSDVYSFGVLLFELIAGRNPQQGLMDYVELAAIGIEGRIGWEEIVDSRLDGAFDVEELNGIAAVAQKCINPVSRKRSSMRDVVQVLSLIIKRRQSRKHLGRRFLPVTSEEESIDMNSSDHQSSVHEHHREESIESLPDLPDV